jgi:hypothetical protein
MEWLEIIKVRMGDSGGRRIDAGYLQQMKDALKRPASTLVNARMYNNVSVANDLVIVLTWRAPIPEPWGSDLASSLAHELKRYGLVDYSAWAGTD